MNASSDVFLIHQRKKTDLAKLRIFIHLPKQCIGSHIKTETLEFSSGFGPLSLRAHLNNMTAIQSP